MRKEIHYIKREVKEIKKHLMPKSPPKFSTQDLVRSFFGSLLVGLTFTFKGLLFEVSFGLKTKHLIYIILLTLAILTFEIYFIGYSRVNKKNKRKFGQFWMKRILTFYSVAIITTVLLLFVYGVLDVLEPAMILNLLVAVSFPCAVGASLGDLLEKY